MELEQLYVVGIDQITPIEFREKAALDKKLPEVIKRSRTLGTESVVLSTCHRSEIYICGEDITPEKLRAFFYDLVPDVAEDLKPYIFVKQGQQTIKHVFRVASGLESMVVGEDQILGQVKEALDMAQKVKGSGKILNRLFLDAITLGKNIRSSTGISENSLSISYIAILFILQVFRDLSQKKAYVIGAGEMGKLAILHLLDKGIEEVLVSNRSIERALELKQEIPGITVVPYEQKYEKIADCDILISATDAPHFTVGYESFKDVFAKERICVVDIALPRDVDPRVRDIPGVSLYTLDDLQQIAKDNQEKRKDMVSIIENMVEEDIDKFLRWFKGLCVVPAMRALKDFADDVCSFEYDMLMNKISAKDQDKIRIKAALERVAKKMVNNYLVSLKTLAETGEMDPTVLKIFQGGGGYQ